jgi:two-component system response regulator AtoC
MSRIDAKLSEVNSEGYFASSSAEASRSIGDLPPEEVIFGSSQAMEGIRRSVEQAANADIPWLLQGETGTGKEVLARFLHRSSRWGHGGFVKINCPAIPSPLIESELFGYERGAFTGAFETKPGKIEIANGGTLFLDEIADLDLGLQAKLLQVLQDGHFCRIGAQKDRKVETRVVCATNRQLHQGIKSGTFRRDLFYRISVISMDLPSLQERRGDIPMLTAYFLRKYSDKYKRDVPPLSNVLLKRFQNYRWPGNIRELQNLIKRYVVLGSEQAISASLEDHETNQDYLGAEIATNEVIHLKKVTQNATKQLERKILLRVLDAHGWHRRSSARALSISYGALLYKMREAGLPAKKGKGVGGVEAPSDGSMELRDVKGWDPTPSG